MKSVWPERLAIVCLALAAVALIGFGGMLSTLAFLVASFMGWTRKFREIEASGKPVLSSSGRLLVGLCMAALGVILLPGRGAEATA